MGGEIYLNLAPMPIKGEGKRGMGSGFHLNLAPVSWQGEGGGEGNSGVQAAYNYDGHPYWLLGLDIPQPRHDNRSRMKTEAYRLAFWRM